MHRASFAHIKLVHYYKPLQKPPPRTHTSLRKVFCSLALVAEVLILLEHLAILLGTAVLEAHPHVEQTSADDCDGVDGHGEDDTRAVALLRLVLVERDRRKNTTKTAEADDDSGHERALRLGADRSLGPRQHEGHIAVAALDGEENTGIARNLLLGAELRVHGGTDNETDAAEHDDRSTGVAVSVGDVGGDEGRDDGPGIRGHVQDHGLDVVEAELSEDDGEEVGEGVGRDCGRHKEPGKEPWLEVCVLDDLGPCQGVVDGVGAVALDTGENDVALLLGEECSAVGEVDEGEVCDNGNDDSHDAEPDEDPRPSGKAARAIHQGEAISNDRGKVAEHGRGRVEQDVALGHRPARVPAREEVCATREECGLENTEDGAETGQRVPVGRKAHADHDDTPEENGGREPVAHTEVTQADLRGNFKDNVLG